MNQPLPEPPLNQRARASVDFLAHLFFGAAEQRKAVNAALENAVSEDALPDDLDERDAAICAVLEPLPSFRVQQAVGEWHSRAHGQIAIDAFDAAAEQLTPQLDALNEGRAKLHADPNFKAPAYWQGVDYHRTTGGWDGHPYMGYIHGEIVHRRMVAALFPGSILKQRRDVAAMAPREHYDQILEMGCSTGHYTLALAEVYPDAQITGVDLSLRTLEHSRRIANANGFAWQLFQRAAEDTGFDAASYDLVTSYILLHEMPPHAIRDLFAEAFRVLRPGGDLLMSDVTRYADMDKLGAWRADRGARYGGEPHWRASASMDMAAALRDAGFENVNARGLSKSGYPFVMQASKPNG